MTDEEILKAAIETAEKNGYPKGRIGAPRDFGTGHYYWFIFSHDFAKAFWGEGGHKWDYPSHDEMIFGWKVPKCKACPVLPAMGGTECCWQHNLQQMVISEEPLKYLDQFLNKES